MVFPTLDVAFSGGRAQFDGVLHILGLQGKLRPLDIGEINIIGNTILHEFYMKTVNR